MQNEEINSLTKQIQTLSERVAHLDLLLSFERLPQTAIVGAEYVARLFVCTVEAAKRGRCGSAI